MEDPTHEVLQQQRLKKRVKLAERLQLPVFVSACLIVWLIEYRLHGTEHVLAWMAIGVCVGCTIWRWVIWRDLRNSLAHKSINDIKGLVSFLALATSSGHKVVCDTQSRLDSMSLLLQRDGNARLFSSVSLLLQKDGNERPFATVYLSDSNPYFFLGSEVETQLRGYPNLRVYMDQDTLNHLAVPSSIN
jgi:hypothetical protein